MPVSVARRIAFDVLLRVETQGAFADELLFARLAEPKLKREDAALATELVMGVLRWQRLLDFLIGRQLESSRGKGRGGKPSAGKRHPAALDPEVRIALRLGLYQLRWLTRVPARAAVHEAVELVKRARKSSAASLVNAVLRNAPQQPTEALIPANLPPAERLAVLHAHPTWLVERWLRTLGADQAGPLLEANNAPPRVTCAVASGESVDALARELASEGVRTAPGRWLCGAIEVTGGAVSRTRAFREGRMRIQDEASQMIALLLEVQSGMKVLDLCAAPGGKALLLAERAGSAGVIVASDLHAHRLRVMRERMLSVVQRIDFVVLDAEQTLPYRGAFDRILVDVPCCGTGTLARNPEIRWRFRPADLLDLQRKQRAILENAAAMLRPGGRLVYSTCSLEPEENEQVVEAVLSQHPELSLVCGAAEVLAPHLRLGAEATDLFDAHGYFRTWPHRHGTDGFFAAVLQRA
ncbi:MAG: 16S rRNA (cytosine(967)-C(5))-methyltransferase RsmB [Candidatus Acidiferrales bacterium]